MEGVTEIGTKVFHFAGGRQKATTLMEQQLQDLNLKQREVMVRLLTQAKDRVQADSESDRDIDERIERDLLPQFIKEGGPGGLVGTVRRLWKELQEAVSALRKLGFFFDDEGALASGYLVPDNLRRIVEAANRSARQERDNALKQYDLAVLGIWATPDIQEARKIAEGLL